MKAMGSAQRKTDAAELLARREREAVASAIGEHRNVGQRGSRQDRIATCAAPPPPIGVEGTLIAKLASQPLRLIPRFALPLDQYLLQTDDARVE